MLRVSISYLVSLPSHGGSRRFESCSAHHKPFIIKRLCLILGWAQVLKVLRVLRPFDLLNTWQEHLDQLGIGFSFLRADGLRVDVQSDPDVCMAQQFLGLP
jgi:hypothetical protein